MIIFSREFAQQKGSADMLIRYKKTYEKIAMGLLSYMPEDRNVKALQESIHTYETDESWHLYLWKNEEDILGLLGMKMEEERYTIHHLSVNPSYRGEGIGKKMVEKLQELFPNKICESTSETKSFLNKCTSNNEGAE